MTTRQMAEELVARWRGRGWLDDFDHDTVWWMEDEIEDAVGKLVREVAEGIVTGCYGIVAEGEDADNQE